MKHTPGPWEANDSCMVFGQSAIEDEAPFVCDTAADGSLGLGYTEEERANAQLIAAAPDMLATLEAIVKWFPVAAQIHGFTATPQCFKDAQELITKAEQS